MQLKLMLFCAASLGVVCLTATARAEDDSGESSDDTEKAEKADEAEERKRAEDDEPADGREEKSKTDAPRFEIALTTTLASYSKLSYTLDIPVVGKVDGSLTNTVFGPSANPVTLEIGYLLSSQFSVGLLLEAGSASTHTSINPPSTPTKPKHWGA